MIYLTGLSLKPMVSFPELFVKTTAHDLPQEEYDNKLIKQNVVLYNANYKYGSLFKKYFIIPEDIINIQITAYQESIYFLLVDERGDTRGVNKLKIKGSLFVEFEFNRFVRNYVDNYKYWEFPIRE